VNGKTNCSGIDAKIELTSTKSCNSEDQCINISVNRKVQENTMQYTKWHFWDCLVAGAAFTEKQTIKMLI